MKTIVFLAMLFASYIGIKTLLVGIDNIDVYQSKMQQINAVRVKF